MNNPRGDRLELAAFRFTPTLIGTGTIYPLPVRARRAWHQLLMRYRQVSGSDGNLPYASLAAALRAAGHTHFNLGPASKDQPPSFLVADQPVDAEDRHAAFGVWEQAILNISAEKIGFSYASELADCIAAIEPDTRSLAQYVTRTGRQPGAPRWVYDIATWQAARLLASATWELDNIHVRFRVDTNGDLLVWDNDLLWSNTWGQKYGIRYAALRLKLSMKTLPHLPDPILLLDPTVFRLANRLGNARTAWLAQDNPAAPLLILGLKWGKNRPADIDYHTRLALTVLTKLRGEQSILPAENDLSGTPGRLRAVIPRSVRFPIGRGVGMHTLRGLMAHAAETLAMQPITATAVAGHRFKRRPTRTLGRDTELLDPQSLPDTIAGAGCRRLRILVLYATTHTRKRIQNLLAYHFDRVDLATVKIDDDTETFLLDDTISVVFHHAHDLLAHGPHDHRAAEADRLPLDAPDGTRILAMCETEYDTAEWAARRKRARSDPAVPDPDTIDAKHPVNRLLACKGVPTQFIAGRTPRLARSDDAQLRPEEALTNTVSKDHRGHSALADLLRSAGLVHTRIGEALSYGRLGLDRPHAFVGLHLREPKAVRGKRQLVYALTALIPDGSRWNMLGYCWQAHPVTGRTGWRDYADANVAFRAHSYSEGARHTAYDAGVPNAINIALRQLKPRLGGIPYVLSVSGESCRTIWPGLANKHLDRTPDPDGTIDAKIPLPGPEDHKPAAIVRITPTAADIPRPVRGITTTNADHKGEDADIAVPIKTTNKLYELDLPGNGRAWILASVPRQFQGRGRQHRLGEDRSRWHAQPEEQEATWYAHTAVEILVLIANDPIPYAVATARLCDHTIAWDGRTRYPAPLHLAQQMDKDHPEYRRTIDLEDDVNEPDQTDNMETDAD